MELWIIIFLHITNNCLQLPEVEFFYYNNAYILFLHLRIKIEHEETQSTSCILFTNYQRTTAWKIISFLVLVRTSYCYRVTNWAASFLSSLPTLCNIKVYNQLFFKYTLPLQSTIQSKHSRNYNLYYHWIRTNLIFNFIVIIHQRKRPTKFHM